MMIAIDLIAQLSKLVETGLCFVANRPRLKCGLICQNLSKPVETGWNIDFQFSPLEWTFSISPRFICGRLSIPPNSYTGRCDRVSQQKLISYLDSHHIDRQSLDYSNKYAAQIACRNGSTGFFNETDR
jgi:hypothetical protein